MTSEYKNTAQQQHESKKYGELANKSFSWALIHQVATCRFHAYFYRRRSFHRIFNALASNCQTPSGQVADGSEYQLVTDTLLCTALVSLVTSEWCLVLDCVHVINCISVFELSERSWGWVQGGWVRWVSPPNWEQICPLPRNSFLIFQH